MRDAGTARRRAAAGRDWTFGRALWDTVSDPAALGSWCATEAALRPGLPLWVVENGMATRVRDGRAEPRDDGMDRPRYVREHLGAVADAVAAGVPVRAYLHWSLVDNYEWGTYEPRFGLFGLDRSDPAAVRWLDTDSAGADAAGEFSRVLAGLRRGDRSVLGRRALSEASVVSGPLELADVLPRPSSESPTNALLPAAVPDERAPRRPGR